MLQLLFLVAGNPAGIATSGFTSGWTAATDIGWDQPAEGILFGLSGNNNLTLAGGTNYDGTSDGSNAGSYKSTVSDLAFHTISSRIKKSMPLIFLSWDLQTISRKKHKH